MQAVIYRQYGGPEVLETARLTIPTAGANQVVVRVAAVGLNPKDVAIRSGALRLLTGRRFPKATGFDFSGVVAGVGPGVTGVGPGDEVFGYLEDLHGGAAAEYHAVRLEWVARKPAAVSHPAMAAVPCAYLTAWQGLVQQARLERGAAGTYLRCFGRSGYGRHPDCPPPGSNRHGGKQRAKHGLLPRPGSPRGAGVRPG